LQSEEKDRSNYSNAYAPKYDKSHGKSKENGHSSRAETVLIMESRIKKDSDSFIKVDPLETKPEDGKHKHKHTGSVEKPKSKIKDYAAVESKSFAIIRDIRNDAKNESRRIIKATNNINNVKNISNLNNVNIVTSKFKASESSDGSPRLSFSAKPNYENKQITNIKTVNYPFGDQKPKESSKTPMSKKKKLSKRKVILDAYHGNNNVSSYDDNSSIMVDTNKFGNSNIDNIIADAEAQQLRDNLRESEVLNNPSINGQRYQPMYVAQIQPGYHHKPSFVIPSELYRNLEIEEGDGDESDNFQGRIKSGMEEIYKEIQIDPEIAFSKDAGEMSDEEDIRNETLNSNEYVLESSVQKIKSKIAYTYL
jgi:hypothetical protein